ncbi:MAG: hypothetical protein ACKPAD_13695, partial [Bacteroidota bacterium]
MSAVLFFQGPNMPFTVTVTGPSFTLGPVLVASVLQLSNLCPGTYQVSIVDNQGFNCSVTPVNIIGLPRPCRASHIRCTSLWSRNLKVAADVWLACPPKLRPPNSSAEQLR